MKLFTGIEEPRVCLLAPSDRRTNFDFRQVYWPRSTSTTADRCDKHLPGITKRKMDTVLASVLGVRVSSAGIVRKHRGLCFSGGCFLDTCPTGADKGPAEPFLNKGTIHVSVFNIYGSRKRSRTSLPVERPFQFAHSPLDGRQVPFRCPSGAR